MAESTSSYNTPILWINTYLQEKIGLRLGIGVPFFPSRPTNIDDITESWVTITPEFDYVTIPNPNYNENEPISANNPKTITVKQLTPESQKIAYSGIMATWDRLIRMRRSPFPHVKQEQALYYFYATEADITGQMVQIQEAVLRLMDREDETAEEINEWAKNKVIDGMSNKFFFHKFRVYQLEEVRDIIDFGTARTYGGNKFIIDFEYHQMPDIIPNL